MKCPTCEFECDRFPILPVHDCSKFRGKNPPRKSQQQILISYLAANQPLTLGRLVSESKCGCMDRAHDAVKRLIEEGKIFQDDSEPPLLRIGKS